MAAGKADVIIQVRMELEKAKKDLDAYKKKIGGMTRVTATQFKKLDQGIAKVTASQKRFTAVTQKAQAPFQAWALSIMFFGMAMQRVFSSIWKTATATFNDVAHSVQGAVTGFDMLQGSVKFLGFVAGEALEPIAMILYPIIDAIASWINDNQTLFASLVVITGVLGTILMVVGTLVLGILGVSTAWGVVGTSVTTFFTIVSGLLAAVTLPLWAIVAIVAAVLAAIWVMWKTNFGGFRDFVKETFGGIWQTIKSIFTNIVNIFKGIWMLLKGIFTGDLDMILAGAKMIFVNFISAIVKLFVGLGAAIANIFIFAFNLVVDVVGTYLSLVMQSIMKTINLLNKIPGINISTDGIQGAMDWLKQKQSDLKVDYLTADQIKTSMGAIDVGLGIGNLYPETGTTTVVNNNVNVEVNGDVDESKFEAFAKTILDGVEANK